MKNLQKRFGSIAVEMGFISKAQLVDALEEQARENIERGAHTLLGQILLRKGHITEPQLNQVLEAMAQRVICAIGLGR